MTKADYLIQLVSDINEQYGLDVTLIFKSYTPEFTCIWDTSDWASSYIDKDNQAILMNDELFDSIRLEGLVNILCHEFGHIIDDFNTPPPTEGSATLESTIAFERAANIIGEKLFKQVYPNGTYWHNHEDLARMMSSTEFYNGTRDQRQCRLDDTFYETGIAAI